MFLRETSRTMRLAILLVPGILLAQGGAPPVVLINGYQNIPCESSTARATFPAAAGSCGVCRPPPACHPTSRGKEDSAAGEDAAHAFL